MVTFKSFLEATDLSSLFTTHVARQNEKGLREYLRYLINSNEDWPTHNIFQIIYEKLGHENFKETLLTSLLLRLKHSEDQDDYQSVLNIIDRIRYEAIKVPAMKYPELNAIEKSAKSHL